MTKKQIRIERLVDTMLQQRQAEQERELQRQLQKEREEEIQRNVVALIQQQQQQHGKGAEARISRSVHARDVKPAGALSLDLEQVTHSACRFARFLASAAAATVTHSRCSIRCEPHHGPANLLWKSPGVPRPGSHTAARDRTFRKVHCEKAAARQRSN